MDKQPFEVGDLVRLKNGKVPQIVRKITWYQSQGWLVKGQYEKSAKWNGPENGWERTRPASDYILLEIKETKMKQLFKVKTNGRFGIWMATDSKGQYVLEMKGKDNEFLAFAPDDLEEVIPYTISIRKITPEDRTVTIHCAMKEGLLEKGELLVDPKGTRYIVTEIDTKCRNPQESPKGLRRIVTQLLDY